MEALNYADSRPLGIRYTNLFRNFCCFLRVLRRSIRVDILDSNGLNNVCGYCLCHDVQFELHSELVHTITNQLLYLHSIL